MKETLNGLVHLVTLGAYVFTAYYAFYVLHVPFLANVFKEYDPGQLKYLTIWDVIVQAVFFLICVLNDMFGSNALNPKKRPFMRKLKDYFHATLSFPVAMFVGITFWSLMFVDRELVLPSALDPYFPWWLNHLMHTMIMVSTVLEMILAPRQYPRRLHGLGGLVVFMLIYLIWIHVIYMKSGVWVYPVMEVLSMPLRIVFLAVLFAFTMILYFAGESLNNLIWGKKYLAESNNPSDLKT